MHPVRFVNSGGVHVAYQVVGAGARDIVFLPGAWGQLEVRWEEPSYARFLRRLAAIGRLIQFDRRGMGMSDRSHDAPTSADHIADLQAVLDVVGAHRPVIVASVDGAAVALDYAAAHPGRVHSLVLYAAYAKAVSDDPESPGVVLDARLLIDSVEHRWGDPWLLDVMAPSRASDPDFVAWWSRYQRASVSPSGAAALIASIATIDVRPVLDDVRVPVLLLHRTGDRLVPIANARYLAAALASATLVELPGDDYMLCAGDVDAIADEVEAFLGVRTERNTRVQPRSRDSTLTPREQEIAALVAKGLSNAQIAARLVLSERTVESHVSAVLRKRNMTSRAQIAAWIGLDRD